MDHNGTTRRVAVADELELSDSMAGGSFQQKPHPHFFGQHCRPRWKQSRLEDHRSVWFMRLWVP
jgi:hypothetical protein